MKIFIQNDNHIYDFTESFKGFELPKFGINP